MSPKANRLGLVLLAIHTIVILITSYLVFFVFERSIYDGNILAFAVLVIYDAPFVYPALWIFGSVIPGIINSVPVPTLTLLCLIFGGLQWYFIGTIISSIKRMVMEKVPQKIRSIILIIIGIPFVGIGGFVIFSDYYFNGPHSYFRFQDGVNPQWAMLMISSLLSIVAGLLLLVKGLKGFERPSKNLPK